MKQILIALALLTQATMAFAQWTPPLGLTTIPFGINEVAPAPTVWVNAQSGSDSNPGTAAKPKRMIPLDLAAGTVVSVSGTYNISHDSPYVLSCHGTKEKPVFILGGNFTLGGQIDGTYCIVENGTGPGGWIITDGRASTPTQSIVFRHYKSTGGFGITTFYGSTNDGAVLYDVTVSGNFTNQTEAGGDDHCVSIGGGKISNFYVLDGHYDHCNGDGVQINGGQGGQMLNGPGVIGRNVYKHNRQSGVWVKYAHSILITQNDISDMRPAPNDGNPGACGGGQYFGVLIVWVANKCYDAENGFIVASFDTDALTGPGVSSYAFFNNNISNIHATSSRFDPANPRSAGNAIVLVGAASRHLQDNVIDNVDGGISVAYGAVCAPGDPCPPFTGSGNVATNVGPKTTPPPVTPPPPAGLPPCPPGLRGVLQRIFLMNCK